MLSGLVDLRTRRVEVIFEDSNVGSNSTETSVTESEGYIEVFEVGLEDNVVVGVEDACEM